MTKSLGFLLTVVLGLGAVLSAQAADDDRSRGVDASHTELQDATWGIGSRSAPMHTPPAALADSLEKAFWACDYAATTRGVDGTPVAFCGAVYEELKQAKFEGNFLRLLAWWKQNKPVEHQRIASEQPIGAPDIGGL